MYPTAFVSLLLVFVSMVGVEASRASQPKISEEFSGENALAHVQRLVDFGPRPPGSEAIEKSRGYIENQLSLSGWQVTRQAFTDDTPRGKVRFVNLIARFRAQGSGASSFLLCSYEDVRQLPICRSQRWRVEHGFAAGVEPGAWAAPGSCGKD